MKNTREKCNECSRVGPVRVPGTMNVECRSCGWVQPMFSIWSMPKKTGYAYSAPPGAFWGR